jgi:DNA modification methylase
MTYQILHGNNLDILPTLADSSIDAIVTDPPYELGFMGKKWDSSGIAYNVELWRECLRVLKPGGHLLSFGGTRTWHRIAVAIEDAGFEVRDSIAWMYGSGFPKSLDISKAIDKEAGDNAESGLVAEYLLKHNTFSTVSEFREYLNKHVVGANHSGGSAQGWTTVSTDGQVKPRVPTIEQRKLLKFDDLNAQVWRHGRKGQPGEAWAEREVIGQQTQGKLAVAPGQDNDRSQVELDITSPATPEAQQWEGWGTALKPAFEPVIVARKPLIGTVAANVLEHGTGGLNIDGSRIGTDGEALREGIVTALPNDLGSTMTAGKEKNELKRSSGRWPSNVILDEYTAGLLDEQSGVSKSPSGIITQGAPETGIYGNGAGLRKEATRFQGHGDKGGASRFFYVAKASKRDRNEGLDELDPQRHSDREKDDGVGGDNPRNRTNQARQNFHPTVKPTALMRYLVKLVTPPGGVVLDPFTGSGSTGKAAILEGFDFIGIELTDEYLPIIEGRLKHAEKLAAEEKEKKDEALF